jgi:hypothetical protein
MHRTIGISLNLQVVRPDQRKRADIRVKDASALSIQRATV